MKNVGLVLVALVFLGHSAVAQTATEGSFKLALPEHRGQLSWSAQGFKTTQYSAKPGGREIGIRGRDQSGRLTFLGFLFLVPEQAPLTSAKCRSGAVELMKKSNPKLKILETSEKSSPGTLPISMASYSAEGSGAKIVYSVRGFVATDDICGDLEVYSDSPITADDSVVQTIFASYRFDQNYSPQFDNVLLYAQTLYQAHMYSAAAPMFEVALVKLKENPDMAARMMGDTKTAARVLTDQGGWRTGSRVTSRRLAVCLRRRLSKIRNTH